MPDGTRPPLLSKVLYEAWENPIPGGDSAGVFEEICKQAEYEELADLDMTRDFLREALAAGNAELKRREQAHCVSGGMQSLTNNESEERSTQSAPEAAGKMSVSLAGTDKPGPGTVRSGGNSAARGQSPARPCTRAVSVLALAMYAARQLPKLAARRTEIVRELAKRAAARDKRREFVEDRAVAVVKQTLLALDEQFAEIGFGSWMPFRFPDQWLMFCGVMTRVLAANGLIHAKHADVYRRLMEETPGVERDPSRGSNPGQSPKAGTVPIDERPPKSWSRIKSMRETETLEALLRKTPKPP